MRPFRGLTKEGEWKYGWYYYNHFTDEHKIFVCKDHSTYDIYDVIPETVGQQVGFKDKKRTKEYPEGQEIYEGDKVSSRFWGGTVEFKKGAFKIIQGGYADSSNFDVVEIIGNIHQPELITEQDNG